MINKLKMLGVAAAVLLTPVAASAVTITAVNDYATALTMVDPGSSLDLSSGASWTDAPLVVAPDASLVNQYRSPFETAGLGATVPGFYSVGGGAVYAGTGNPAILALDAISDTISLFWGSPDGFNTLELLKGNTVVATISGALFNNPAIEASFVSITADGPAEYFDTVKFIAQTDNGTANAFEFSNVRVAAVPVPAAGFLLMGALGALGVARRRKKSA